MNTFLLAELMTPNADVGIILPELIVALAGVVVMLYDSYFPKQRTVSGIISLAGLAASGIALGSMWTGNSPASGWNGMIAHDNLRLSFSFVFLLVTALTILISTVWLEREDVPVGEYHCLLLFATFGKSLTGPANDVRRTL